MCQNISYEAFAVLKRTQELFPYTSENSWSLPLTTMTGRKKETDTRIKKNSWYNIREKVHTSKYHEALIIVVFPACCLKTTAKLFCMATSDSSSHQSFEKYHRDRGHSSLVVPSGLYEFNHLSTYVSIFPIKYQLSYKGVASIHSQKQLTTYHWR